MSHLHALGPEPSRVTQRAGGWEGAGRNALPPDCDLKAPSLWPSRFCKPEWLVQRWARLEAGYLARSEATGTEGLVPPGSLLEQGAEVWPLCC